MRIGATAIVLSGCICAGLGLALAAEEIVLDRRHPTRVRWGEVAVFEATSVRLAPRGQEQEYANGLALTFLGRTREPAIEAQRFSDRRSRSEVKSFGSFLLAANFDQGQEEWDRFKNSILELAGRIRPDAYAEFLGELTESVETSALDAAGSCSVVLCASVPGGEEQAREILRKHVSIDQGGPAWLSGSTQFDLASPVCAELRVALDYLAASQVFMTDLEITETVEETLRVSVVDRMNLAPGLWPAAVQLARAPAPEGALDYESRSNDGPIRRYEQRREPRRAVRGAESAPYLLVAEVAPVALDRRLVGGRSLLLRWSLAARTLRLGAEPRTLDESSHEVNYAVFPASGERRLTLDNFKAAVARRLEKVGGLIDVRTLKDALIDSNAALGDDEVLAAFCALNARADDEAEYCLAKACAPVLNAQEFCSALRATLFE